MPRSIHYLQDGPKKPCPIDQHRPVRPIKVGHYLRTCRFCGTAYMK
jgi:hypothetical protein